MIIDLGNKSQVPIISSSATSPSLTSIRSPYFIRAATNDLSQVGAISALVQAFGWRQVVPIYEDDDFGEGMIPCLTDASQDIDVRVPYRSVVPTLASDDQIIAELYKLQTMQTRVFLVHMWSTLGSRFFTIARQIGRMDDKEMVWIITDSLANLLTAMDDSVLDSKQGVLGVRPYVPRIKERDNFTKRWTMKFQQDNSLKYNPELNVFGLWAYDAAIALAIAVEQVGASNLSYQKTITSTNSTDLETFGVSKSGPKLIQALQNNKFRGLNGPYKILDGQLQIATYEIINIIGYAGRRIGYWTLENGIIRKLNSSNTNRDKSSTIKHGAIIGQVIPQVHLRNEFSINRDLL